MHLVSSSLAMNPNATVDCWPGQEADKVSLDLATEFCAARCQCRLVTAEGREQAAVHEQGPAYLELGGGVDLDAATATVAGCGLLVKKVGQGGLLQDEPTGLVSAAIVGPFLDPPLSTHPFVRAHTCYSATPVQPALPCDKVIHTP